MSVQSVPSVPSAHSERNFRFYEPYIAVAISNMEHDQPTSFDCTLAGRAPDTFSARFRNAVRYGYKYGYLSNLFSPTQLYDLLLYMRVSMANPPYVWVYKKGATEPWKQSAPASLTTTTTAKVAGTLAFTLTFSPSSLDELMDYLKIKSRFKPLLTVRLLFELKKEDLLFLEESNDCSITPFGDGNEGKEWLVL